MSQTATETVTEVKPEYVVPKQCKAGVVVNEGPDFWVVSFSKPSLTIGSRRTLTCMFDTGSQGDRCSCSWPGGCSYQAQRNRSLHE